MTDIMYEIKKGNTLEYQDPETYKEHAAFFSVFGYEVKEVTELPLHKRTVYYIENGEVNRIINPFYIKELANSGVDTVGRKHTFYFAHRKLVFQLVEINGLRTVWERIEGR